MSRALVSAPSTPTQRRRVAGALARTTLRERLVLALLLVEHLTPAEVARALDCPITEVERTYRLLIAGARAALRRRGTLRGSRAIARAALSARLRRAA